VRRVFRRAQRPAVEAHSQEDRGKEGNGDNRAARGGGWAAQAGHVWTVATGQVSRKPGIFTFLGAPSPCC
jgi:hypothetical protein